MLYAIKINFCHNINICKKSSRVCHLQLGNLLKGKWPLRLTLSVGQIKKKLHPL